MDFISSIDTYGEDAVAQSLWRQIRDTVGGLDGYCFYKHPVFLSTGESTPDLTLLARGYKPTLIRVVQNDVVAGEIRARLENVVLEIEDYLVSVSSRVDRDRVLRGTVSPVGVLVVLADELSPQLLELAAASRQNIRVILSSTPIATVLDKTAALEDEPWLRLKATFQGLAPVNRSRTMSRTDVAATKGAAIKMLETQLALLDNEQLQVAIQMAPGPQRIRGLAGSGKTIILAMKAANIHLRYPEARILFTFHTQSLYNQTRTLISRFYRDYSGGIDPNWDVLDIRHGWGGRERPGVYYEAARRQGVRPLTLREAVALDSVNPLSVCCQQLLDGEVEPIYDFIIMDEAQDFPVTFFKLLARLCKPPYRIYFAYDELQSLGSLEIPDPETLFGTDASGLPVVSLGGDDYPGEIKKDFVLEKSYRCPLDILLCAHSIGLGLYRPEGPVQILTSKSSWEGSGYTVRSGSFEAGSEIIVERPPTNSPNPIKKIFPTEDLISVHSFETRQAELSWVAGRIAADITSQEVPPEKIFVVSLDSRRSRTILSDLESELLKHRIKCMTPGIGGDASWEFAEPGFVTLTSVFRAKGNEAPCIYIVAGETLYSYAEQIENRNKAFTSFSRSKAWLTISGTGPLMKRVSDEVNAILEDVPLLKFTFPDLKTLPIRRLDTAEISRRKREVSTAAKSVDSLLEIDEAALTDLDSEKLRALRELLQTLDIG